MKSAKFIYVRQRDNFRYGTAIAFLLGIGTLAACHTRQQVITHHEDRLAAAGSIVRPEKTPERLEMLTRLPAHRF